MEVVNNTPYAMERAVIFDRAGRETLLVIVKGTFDFDQGATRVAEEQRPVVMADEYYGEPGETSIRVATDMLPTRPHTGVTLSGHAFSPRGPVPKLPVGLKVGKLVQKAWVLGRRVGFQNVGRPEEFERMSLTWENAFGGVDTSHDNPKRHDGQADNPVGKGFIARMTQLDPDRVELPNIENPEQMLSGAGQRPKPVGFGPIGPVWMPRREYAGTYDDAWQKERAPLLPDDFDERFLQAAPPALTAGGYFDGTEECELLGMTAEGRVRFSLGAKPPVIGVRLARKGIRSNPVLESVHFDTDARQFTCTWKSMVDVQGRVEELRSIEGRVLS